MSDGHETKRPRLANPLDEPPAEKQPAVTANAPADPAPRTPPTPTRHRLSLRSALIAMVVFAIAFAGYASSKAGGDRQTSMILFIGLLPFAVIVPLIIYEFARKFQKIRFSIRFVMLLTTLVAIAVTGYNGMNVGGDRRIGALLFTLLAPIALLALLTLVRDRIRRRR